MRTSLYLFMALFLVITSAFAEDTEKPIIYKIDIRKDIDNTTFLYLRNGLNEANELGAKAIVLNMNTYGGLVDVADSMRTAILYNPIPVYVFINNNAASAGALISIACKKIFMRKGASIGAATVVNQMGEAMPDKYQSYMRATIRATAEAHGKDTIINGNDTTYKWKRDPLIAEAMVDERVIIPNLIDSTKVLTFTAEEAMKWNYCEAVAESIDEVIRVQLGFDEYQLVSYEPTWVDDTKGFLMNPILQSLLILVIIGGIYFEMQQPGLGLPSLLAILAAILYFAPLYIVGLAANWEILLFVLGIILVLLEIFVIPGTGIAGIIGGLFIIVGLTLSLLENVNFDFEGVASDDALKAFLTVGSGLVFGTFLTIWLSSRIGHKGVFRQLALNTDVDQTLVSEEIKSLIGLDGIAATVLRPSGKVEINDELYDGVSDIGFIDKGEKVRVVRYENAQVYVEKI